MTKKSRKKKVAELPPKCVFCGAKKSKSDSDLSKTTLLPNGRLKTIGKVLCCDCGEVYMKTEVFEVREPKSE